MRVDPVGRRAAIAVAGALALSASSFLPWVSVRLGGTAVTYDGFDLPVVAVLSVSVCAAMAALAVAWWLRPDDRIAMLIVSTASASLAATLVLLLAVELAGDFSPASILPVDFEGPSDVATPGPGLWVGLAASLVVLLSAGEPLLQRRYPRLRLVPTARRAAAVWFVLLSLFVLVGWSRYQPWLESSVAGGSPTLSGRAVPVVGFASLVALALLGVALVLAAIPKSQTAGLVAAGSGWLLSFAAAISLIAGETLARIEVGDVGIPAAVAVTFNPGIAAWVAFTSGIMTARSAHF